MLDAALFDYSRSEANSVRTVGTRKMEGYSTSLIVYTTPAGVRRVAEIYTPEGDGPFPAILYVHWLAETPNANRTQFEEEAIEMAKQGAVCLLVETMWSERDWFIKRTQEDDFENSVRQVVELGQACDILLSQPGVDPARFAYVGHDFGAMYGALMGSIDNRPTHYVLVAGTPRFPDWYLYYPRLEGEEREAFINRMDPLDPINRVTHLSPAPIFFQFATRDEHIAEERALAFYAAARDPKEIAWYDADHGMNEEAARERKEWLNRVLLR